MTVTHPVRMVPCPFEAAPLIEALWWHPMHERDAGHQWLRQRFADAAQQIGAPDRNEPAAAHRS
jgi:hypothetical protein